jgi:threonine/homoserine/homoserine lactone efflux protein
MPSFETLMIFTTAAIAITLVPGPSMLYVASRSIVHGRTAGIWSALGLATGLFIHTVSASLGLSAILVYFPPVFFIIKYLGAAYLIYLGIQMLRTNKRSPLSREKIPELNHVRVYGQGVITEILNPKTALFFLSFLPQFIDPVQGSSTTQMMILGGILVFTALVADLFIAISGGALSRSVLAQPLVQKIQNWLAGTVLIALGLRLAISEQK